uniref:FadR family transcriptional regulator n=1 Tax=Candidatus Caldatribacterium saccharofermentans TaxID=1454753 RepID=A0A7V4WM23_9BACT
MLKNLKVESRYAMVQEAIKNYIIVNKLKPGDRLPTEQEFAKQLGVSRTSLREALKSLQALGIVDIKPGEGTIVRAFNLDAVLGSLMYNLLFESTELLEILQVREALEYHFLDRVIDNIRLEDIQKLERILALMEKKAKQGELFDEEDAAFHRLLFAPVGNSLLLRLLDIFWEVLHRLRDPIEVERDPLGSYMRHKRILEAVKEKDKEKARAFLVEHFISIKERVEKAVQKKQIGKGEQA